MSSCCASQGPDSSVVPCVLLVAAHLGLSALSHWTTADATRHPPSVDMLHDSMQHIQKYLVDDHSPGFNDPRQLAVTRLGMAAAAKPHSPMRLLQFIVK